MHTLNGEISTESVYISVNNNTNLKKNLVSFCLHYMGEIKLKNHLTLLSLKECFAAPSGARSRRPSWSAFTLMPRTSFWPAMSKW
jgi:hypothetical protein